MLQELVLKNRSYRRFYQEHEITKSELINFIDMARLSPSPRNQQALKFIISCEKQKNNKIFETLSWAGAIQNWDGPKEGEKPSAYIIILGDNDIVPSGKNSFNEAAYGIAAQTILLATVEKELGGCMIAAIKKNILRKELEIDTKYEILLVLAIGKPKENITLVEMEDDDFSYYRDENQNHFVPKRKLDDIILT